MNRDTMLEWGRPRESQSYLRDLTEVLRAHPSGLRRWSVMRAMRMRYHMGGKEIPLKFEDDVERVFRRHCAGDSVRTGMENAPSALFHRPKDKAGEVWAVYPDKGHERQHTD